jgi:hypothetical protein
MTTNTATMAEPKSEKDELEKIMSEIEGLQQELEDSAQDESSPSVTLEEPVVPPMSGSLSQEEEDILKEIQASAQMSEGMEDTLADLKSEDTGSSILDEMEAVEAVTEEENPMKEDGSLTLTLKGNMTLKLKYEFEGQEVTVSFADQSLRVQMSDGTEFKVPVSRMATSNIRPIKKTG